MDHLGISPVSRNRRLAVAILALCAAYLGVLFAFYA
jgi:hypothetical protein